MNPSELSGSIGSDEMEHTVGDHKIEIALVLSPTGARE